MGTKGFKGKVQENTHRWPGLVLTLYTACLRFLFCVFFLFCLFYCWVTILSFFFLHKLKERVCECVSNLTAHLNLVFYTADVSYRVFVLFFILNIQTFLKQYIFSLREHYIYLYTDNIFRVAFIFLTSLTTFSCFKLNK